MIRIGIISKGGNGEQINFYIKKFLTVIGIEISGIYVTDDLVVKQDEIKKYFNYEELFLNSDAIYFLETDENHFEMVQTAFRQGKHVFIEQISSLGIGEIEQLLLTNKEANVKCVIGNFELSHPAYLSIKKEINNPLYIESQRSMIYDKKNTKHIILYDMLKDLAVILSIVQSDIKRILTSGFKVMNSQIDFANVRLEFSNGSVANITINKCARNNESRMILYEEGCITSCDFQNSETIVNIKSKGKSEQPKIKKIPLPSIDPLVYQLENFRDSILKDIDPILKLREGYEKLDIAYKISNKINSFSEQ